MREYTIQVTGTYEKEFNMQAVNALQAKAMAKDALLNTDLISFHDEDLISLQADIQEAAEEEMTRAEEFCEYLCGEQEDICPLCKMYLQEEAV